MNMSWWHLMLHSHGVAPQLPLALWKKNKKNPVNLLENEKLPDAFRP